MKGSGIRTPSGHTVGAVVTPRGQDVSLTQEISPASWLVLTHSCANCSIGKLRALLKADLLEQVCTIKSIDCARFSMLLLQKGYKI